MRLLLSTLLFLHGLVHVVGFIGPMNLLPSSPFQSTVLGRQVSNDSLLVRSLGVLWLLTALAFSVASVAAYALAPWWLSFTAGAIFVSTLLCAIAWPISKAGLLINALLLLALLAARHSPPWLDFISLLRACS